VCLHETCLKQQEFYTAYEVSGKFPHKVEGLLGIGTKYSEEPSLIKELVREALVHRAMIGLELTPNGGEVTFGDYASDKIRGGDDGMVWINNLEPTSWSFEISEAKLGGYSLFHH